MAHKRDIDQYLSDLMDSVGPLTPVVTPVLDSNPLSHVAEDIQAALPIPKFDNSAVDGFAVLTTDLQGNGAPWTFPVVGDTPAGAAPQSISLGQAIRVMTGGPVPLSSAALTVIPVELTNAPADHSLPDEITINQHPGGRDNIRIEGEHLHIGDSAVSAQTPLDAGTVATLISVGVSEVSAHPCPRVTVITTGDELATSNKWGIPNSNGPMLMAELQRLGIQNPRCMHTHDDVGALAEVFDQSAKESDLIITVGGISAGAFDVVKALGAQAGGFEFFPVAMQPGKPQGHGRWKGTKVVCLPGNPVAAWVSFRLFIIPVINRLGGAKRVDWMSELPAVQLRTPRALPAREGTVLAIPVEIDWATQTAHSVAHRSHMVGALAGCAGIALVSGESVPEGGLCHVVLGRI
ncbi:molybdopterin molybdotransferase MoeA [Corynebacterium crudilactis]|uniref:Molybdopterin molybdenumtransferase n=1 Tax=Corynebacterium crudilactis TaxID=1652495 RepID=A0A172QSW6_9CORY|nr:molybdopterin molybdotransferase MoeA [Corynebacterium crudilactis]ANE03766.1 molybdopterin molybdenumtransferase MoeA [Corynebacterium crudilactis]